MHLVFHKGSNNRGISFAHPAELTWFYEGVLLLKTPEGH